jgi:hypothetical protein
MDDRQPAFLLVWVTERACYQRIVQGGDPGDAAFLNALTGVWERSAAAA